MHIQFLLLAKFEVCFSFPLILWKESLQNVLISCQGCAPRMLDELSKPKVLQCFPYATAAAARRRGNSALFPSARNSRKIL